MLTRGEKWDIHTYKTSVKANPSDNAVYDAYGLGLLELCDHEFESRSRHWYTSAFFCVVLSCVGRGLAMHRSPIQGDLEKCLNGFIFSEVSSELEQARGPNRETHNNNVKYHTGKK
jgi:hypothetical protein